MLKTFLTKTDSSCFIDGVQYPDLPLLLTDEEVLHVQSDYLRELTLKRGLSPGSVYETAKYLRTHLHVMDEAGLQWEQTSEVALRRWRNNCAGAKPTNPRKRYLNQILRAIYSFLIWAEQAGHIAGVIGPLSPLDTKLYPVPVAASGNSNGAFRFPLLYRAVGESDQRNATKAEVDELFAVLANEENPYVAERNLLIARLAENALLRRHEIAALTVGQLPSLEAARNALVRYEELTIELHITKGGKPRYTIVDPQLVIDTWHFISGTRSELLAAKGKKYDLNYPVFLSWRNGQKLHLDSISNIFSSKQKEAGITRASAHKLRSIGATNRVENLIEMYLVNGAPLPDEETLLLQAQEILGHASVDTTRKYIRREKKRRLDHERTVNSDIRDRRETLRNLDREIAARECRLSKLDVDGESPQD